jgi:hypothetical protein
MIIRKILLLIAGVLVVLGAPPCLAQEALPERAEVEVLPLEGPLAHANAEISGLAWHGDQLLILPQFPRRFGDKRYGRLFALPRQVIRDALEGSSQQPLTPRPIRFADRGLRQTIENFEGYEALAVQGDRIFLTVESSPQSVMQGDVVAGQLSREASFLKLNVDSMTELPSQTTIDNMAYETLVTMDRHLLAIYEANGVNVNPNPAAYRIDSSLDTMKALPFPTLEYRVTDATALDEQGRFWVINFFYPGDRFSLNPAFDAASPPGLSSSFPLELPSETPVERLVELRYTRSGIVRTNTPLLPLEALKALPARNWEGLVRLSGSGFLIMTDTYPRTIAGFVPYNDEAERP